MLRCGMGPLALDVCVGSVRCASMISFDPPCVPEKGKLVPDLQILESLQSTGGDELQAIEKLEQDLSRK